MLPVSVQVCSGLPLWQSSLTPFFMHAGTRKPWLDAEGQVHLPLMFVYPETMQVSCSCRCSFR